MPQLSIEELPYHIDSTVFLQQITGLNHAVFLDSAAPFSSRGRYDILVADPELRIPPPVASSDGHVWFTELQQSIQQVTPRISNDYHLPFVGGAVGYFGYDLGSHLENIPKQANTDLNLPCAGINLYSWAIIVDHRQQRSMLIAHPAATAEKLERVRDCIHQPTPGTREKFQLQEAFTANFSQQSYQRAFQRIQEYLLAGDCYQVNLAQRFKARFTGSPLTAYQRLRRTAAAPFSAFMDTGDQQILSLSPERFLHVVNQRVTTAPIKGTRPRDKDPERDRKLARDLLDSEKDRAENLMIVDLLRNDLGKACQAGSIQVEELFELQSFETVHHLVSTISGQLKPDYEALHLLADSFPGGSITGAPKVRAMQIIEELEPHRRNAYCGAIGYISCDGQMDTNIAIRTLVCEQNTIYCWAGGGIVADSYCDAEYQECMNKVGALLGTLEETLV